ncbi:MAG TPA: hypothetical protein VIX86_07640 [Streptosporangiaceae bacterium]
MPPPGASPHDDFWDQINAELAGGQREPAPPPWPATAGPRAMGDGRPRPAADDPADAAAGAPDAGGTGVARTPWPPAPGGWSAWAPSGAGAPSPGGEAAEPTGPGAEAPGGAQRDPVGSQRDAAAAGPEADEEEEEAAPSPWSIPLTVSDLGDLDEDHDWQPGELPAWANEPDDAIEDDAASDAEDAAADLDESGQEAVGGHDAEDQTAAGQITSDGTAGSAATDEASEPAAPDRAEATALASEPAGPEQPATPADERTGGTGTAAATPDDVAEADGTGAAGTERDEHEAEETSEPAGVAPQPEVAGDDRPGGPGSGQEGTPEAAGSSEPGSGRAATEDASGSAGGGPDGPASAIAGSPPGEATSSPAGEADGSPSGADGGPSGAAADAGTGGSAASLDDEVAIVPGVARYHRTGCILIRFLGDGDLESTTRRQAEAKGCVPCRACEPEKAVPASP